VVYLEARVNQFLFHGERRVNDGPACRTSAQREHTRRLSSSTGMLC
jgi:hypothetical protein